MATVSVNYVGLVSLEDARGILKDPRYNASLVLFIASWNSLSVERMNRFWIQVMEALQVHELGHASPGEDDTTGEICLQLLAIQADENDETLQSLCDLRAETHDPIHAPAELPSIILCSNHDHNWLPIQIESNSLQILLSHPNGDSRSPSFPRDAWLHRCRNMAHTAIRMAVKDRFNVLGGCRQSEINGTKYSSCYVRDNDSVIVGVGPQENLNLASTISECLQPTHIGNLPLTAPNVSFTESFSSIEELLESHQTQQPLRIFVAGDKTQVGKSTICLGLLGSLLALRYHPSELAYIKPATQCEATTLIAQYCTYHGIDAVPIGPVVYYRGFTRSYLRGEVGATSSSMLEQISQATDALAYGYSTNLNGDTKKKKKKILIIDGVGYPAVGSICGTDNADVAHACGYPLNQGEAPLDDNDEPILRRPAPVLIVGKSGIGDAIDSYNLNASYFKSKHVPVLGVVFNRLSTDPTNYYNLENCKESIESYFQQFKNDEHVYGLLPKVDYIPDKMSDETIPQINRFISLFSSHVQVENILRKAVTMSTLTCESKVWRKKIKSSGEISQRTVLSRNKIEEHAKRLGTAAAG